MASATRLFAALVCLAALARAGELRAGRAAVKITPPAGVPLGGSYSVRLAEGTHDDLFAKALVLEAGSSRAAFVSCDLISLDDGTVRSARRLIEEQTAIPAGQVMISATHTHTGPLMAARLFPYMPAPGLKLLNAYRASLPSRVAEAVRMAAAATEPVRVSAGSGQEASISFYRRYLLKDGSVRTNPGKMNPEVVQPMGEIDPEVAVVRFDAAAKTLATYVNFALHLDTAGGLHYSADYPYTLAKILSKLTSPDMLTVFTAGAAGNINHIDVRNPSKQSGHAEAARIGTILAGEVIKTLARLKPVEAGELRFARETVSLPVPVFTEEEAAKARTAAANFGKKGSAGIVEAVRIADVAGRKGEPLEAEVQVIALGDRVAWVGLPGEIFVELGMAIKKASPFPQTIVVSLANGWIGYVPTRKGFAEGSYEAVSARFKPGGGEALAETAIRLLAGAHRSAR